MKEMDDMLKQVFQDKPIAQESLQRMSSGIMDQILAAPMNFQEQRLLAQRRKVGFIFLGTVVTLSFSLFLLNWFLGPWLSEGLKTIGLWLTANVPFLGYFLGRWDWLIDTIEILANIKLGFEFLWGQYGFSIMGILFVWVLFEGLRSKLNHRVID
ncbi:hypothetical protein Desdi_0553 [Desulfitobacterium dichloroeliminans LMG P-21439]|uniref:Uncharacterized protein n=1 Tax=Desulfitobacterium dichloroeliminans (strain LMG P-21439 / DCA1) TaxID=871963 RepID=L0F625_DESDL|nr:hypothetical protein [Desulfitobacterium dichloroeliminans]AGA68086.1 hypothetical protein Desdi_0553 [Desulfitobacterium dichloroeliminans LMG P-21439]